MDTPAQFDPLMTRYRGSRFTLTVMVMVMVAVAVLAAGCSGGSSDAEGRIASTSTTESADTTVSTHQATTAPTPAATTSASVLSATAGAATQADTTPMLDSLIDRHDDAVAAVLADPGVATSDGNSLVRAYLDLFATEATFPAKVIESWKQEATAGHHYRPGPRGRLASSSVLEVTSRGPASASFTVCTLNSIEVVDDSGALVSSQGGQSAATVDATLVDGTWLLVDLTQIPSSVCPVAGGVR